MTDSSSPRDPSAPKYRFPILAILHVVVGGVWWWNGFYDLDQVFLAALLGCLLMVAALGLWRGTPLGRVAAIGVHGLLVLFLCVITLAYLTRPAPPQNPFVGGFTAGLDRLVLIATWIMLAPLSIATGWRLWRTRDASIQPGHARFRFDTAMLVAAAALVGVLIMAAILQVERIGEIRLLDQPRLAIRIHSLEEMARRRRAAEASQQAAAHQSGLAALDRLVAAAANDSADKVLQGLSGLPNLSKDDLLPLLKNPDPRVRAVVTELLGTWQYWSTKEEQAALVETVGELAKHDGDARVRIAAARALSSEHLSGSAAIARLGKLQESDDIPLRRAVVDSLVRIYMQQVRPLPDRLVRPDRELMEFILRALADNDPEIRFAAIRALSASGVHARSAREPLRKLLETEAMDAKRWTAVALLVGGSRAEELVPYLAEALNGSDEALRQATVEALKARAPRNPEPLVSPLIQMVEQGSPDEVRAAMSALAECEGAAGPAVPALRRRLVELPPPGPSGEPNPPPHLQNVAYVLRRVGPAAEAAVPDLIRMSGMGGYRGEQYARSFVLTALARIAPDSPEVARVLTAGLVDESVEVRRAAAEGLSRSAAAPQTSVEALRARLTDEDYWVRLQAARYLCRLDALDPQALPLLQKQLNELEATVRGNPEAGGEFPGDRNSAMHTLGGLGEVTGNHIAAMIQVLDSPRPDERIAAARALGQLGPKATAAVPALSALLATEDAELQQAAEDALGQIQGSETTTAR